MELVYMLVLETSALSVRVRVPPRAPNLIMECYSSHIKNNVTKVLCLVSSKGEYDSYKVETSERY